MVEDPGYTVTCPGCEENCFMPVYVRKREDGFMQAFVACDKLDYMGPVTIPQVTVKGEIECQNTDRNIKCGNLVKSKSRGSE